ncbi:MAG: hypothetical protein KDJ38_07090 [Gammaproteobacteria bacterium]|nr:hypothetical protein [Gammaproteobacteria bacterium]
MSDLVGAASEQHWVGDNNVDEASGGTGTVESGTYEPSTYEPNTGSAIGPESETSGETQQGSETEEVTEEENASEVVTSPAANGSDGDTESASGGSDNTTESASNGSGNTTSEPAPSNSTPPAQNTTDTTTPDTDSGTEVSAATGGVKALPFISFTAPAVNLPGKPALGAEVKLSDTGTVVKRISDYGRAVSGDMPNFYDGNDSQLSHTYPRHHPFSKNDTYILGNGGWRWRGLWKADGSFVREIQEAGSGEAIWANTEDEWIYIIDHQDQKSFAKTNVLTDEKIVLRTFPYAIKIGQSEGDISDDDKKVAFSSNDNGSVRVTAYDIENDSYIEKTLSRSFSELDWVSVSRSGDYILVSYHKGVREVLLYDWDMNFIRRITNAQHGDIGWDENGDECWFSVGWLEPDTSRTTVGKWRLSDNAYTEVLGGSGRFRNSPDSLSGHLSARATDRTPGVVYISNDDDGGPFTLFGIKTDGSELIQLFGWDGSEINGNYYNQPHLATNRNGRIGVFKSNWKNSNDATEMYLVYRDPDA